MSDDPYTTTPLWWKKKKFINLAMITLAEKTKNGQFVRFLSNFKRTTVSQICGLVQSVYEGINKAQLAPNIFFPTNCTKQTCENIKGVWNLHWKLFLLAKRKLNCTQLHGWQRCCTCNSQRGIAWLETRSSKTRSSKIVATLFHWRRQVCMCISKVQVAFDICLLMFVINKKKLEKQLNCWCFFISAMTWLNTNPFSSVTPIRTSLQPWSVFYKKPKE